MTYTQTQNNNLQKQLTDAFSLLRKGHPVVEESIFKSYIQPGDSIDDYHIFDPVAFSSYRNKYESILKHYLTENEFDYYMNQLPYFKASLIIMTILSADPSIIETDDGKPLMRLLENCLEETEKTHSLLKTKISDQISLPEPFNLPPRNFKS